ncbi:hypothetical protein RHSIM_Rhsim03G0131300 [Rhododendron simsii]|uniref:ABC transporter family G domain-containing protein n=1 Tax=Rhododendron simsii TaxID=118357 RepID=A0A834H3H4_RHOSS|nr:hypothetical protein RHSIM_Rhsim03G0131300 [Rhododendron simsii]
MQKFVAQVIEVIELDGIKDSLVGILGQSGLSTEQRKRLTNAAELVFNPSITFMDEATSGLHAKASVIVMGTVTNIVAPGRTTVCTLHQPSIDIFKAFDELRYGSNKANLRLYLGVLILRSSLGLSRSSEPEDFRTASGIVVRQRKLGVDGLLDEEAGEAHGVERVVEEEVGAVGEIGVRGREGVVVKEVREVRGSHGVVKEVFADDQIAGVILMADGTILLADGLGVKALDSNEIRRKQSLAATHLDCCYGFARPVHAIILCMLLLLEPTAAVICSHSYSFAAVMLLSNCNGNKQLLNASSSENCKRLLLQLKGSSCCQFYVATDVIVEQVMGHKKGPELRWSSFYYSYVQASKFKIVQLAQSASSISDSMRSSGNHLADGIARIILLWNDDVSDVQVVTANLQKSDNKPWFLFGDFNIFKKENQKNGGNGIGRCQDGNVQIAGYAIVWRSCTAELFQVLEEVMLHCIMAHDIG